MKKRKILFLISRFLDGGIDTILVEYLRNLDFSKLDVTLGIGIHMGELEVHLHRIPKEVRIVHLVEEPLFTSPRKKKITGELSASGKVLDEIFLNPVRRIRMKGVLRRLVKDSDVIVDFDSTFYSFLSDCRKPVIGFYHFSIEENLKRQRRHTLRQMKGMAHYRNIVLLSDVMVKEGVRFFPELKEKFVRIYNGYDLPKLRERGDEALEEGIAPGRYFLMVARLEESQKDYTTLLHAFAEFQELSERVPGAEDISLLIAGEGKDREKLTTLAETLGIARKVRFLGFRSNPLPLMRNSLALVHSSKYEGFGLVIAEALALGKAVVASDCKSGPAEILENGESGILFPVGDTHTLAKELLKIACEPEFRTAMEWKGLRRSEAFDISRSVGQLMDLFRNGKGK